MNAPLPERPDLDQLAPEWERLQLLARVRRHLFGSTLRGWAVARMLQPAEQPQEGAA